MSGAIILLLLALCTYIVHRQGVKVETNNSVVGGVCAGIARQLGWAPKVVRWLAVISLVISFGFTLVLYLLLWLTLPRR